ncbi:hypothetical protein A6U84_25905 (plasmid) [Agrobacterium sp. 13-2099-1-2]|uniref:hypothetical protein n=1 Tax=Agrobacterium sp. 13-2099-1-2 TaxID=1841651 RepID=UPI00080FF812|nr:hypothetical protein [Agrobacterium sp. 13-2099-1-2]UZX45508.1 hypothetical protein A6U84_25905 [Agrobacterium sp. 13-2099-1-2]
MRTLTRIQPRKPLIAAAFLLTAWLPTDASASVRTCIKALTAGKLTTDPVGERLVREVAGSIGIHRKITVIACPDGVDKASADEITDDEVAVDVPRGEYIAFNPEWVREVVGDQSEPGQPNRVPAIAVFGHELGHLLYRHFDLNSNKPLRESEAEADHFAGCAVASDGGSWEQLEEFMHRLRSEKDELYPDRLMSLDSALDGFKACRGGNVDASSDYLDMVEDARETPIIALPDGLYCGRTVSDLEIKEVVGISVQPKGCDIDPEGLGFVIENNNPEILPTASANPKRIKARTSCYPVNFRDEAKRFLTMMEDDLSKREHAAECRFTLSYYRLIKSQYLEDLDQISSSNFVAFHQGGDGTAGRMFSIESADGSTKRRKFNLLWSAFDENMVARMKIIGGVFDSGMMDQIFTDKLGARQD